MLDQGPLNPLRRDIAVVIAALGHATEEAPSGEVAALLVQDYVNGESRAIPFIFGTIEIENDGSTVSVFLLA